MEALEKTHSIKILIALAKSNKEKLSYSDLKKATSVRSNTSIYARLNELKKISFIDSFKEEKTKEGRYIGVSHYIWLTEKGRSVAEKLLEIEEMLNE